MTVVELIFRCISCECGASAESFPLCTDCLGKPKQAPKLCSNCASPVCGQNPLSADSCTRPWISNAPIRSFSARYLLIEPGSFVLRRWKTRRGPLFDRKILNSDANLRKSWMDTQARAVIPVPQFFERAWKMRGSPTRVIAGWVGREMGIPVLPLLIPTRNHETKSRQAELFIADRLQNKIRFEADPRFSPRSLAPYRPSVLLVDDFITSGHTIRSAARFLDGLGFSEIHAFSLGIRPFRAQK